MRPPPVLTGPVIRLRAQKCRMERNAENGSDAYGCRKNTVRMAWSSAHLPVSADGRNPSIVLLRRHAMGRGVHTVLVVFQRIYLPAACCGETFLLLHSADNYRGSAPPPSGGPVGASPLKTRPLEQVVLHESAACSRVIYCDILQHRHYVTITGL